MGPFLKKLALLSAAPIMAALYLGIVLGVFAEAISAGVTALIAGVPLAVAAGLLAGRAFQHSADAIANEAGAEELGSRLAPLPAKISEDETVRFNLIHPGLDPDGAPADIAVLNLARRLAENGHRPRLILLETEKLHRHWRQQLAGHRHIGDAILDLEVFDATGRTREIGLNPEDHVVATDWATAHVADDLCRHLRRPRFVYLIREYQPFEFSMGSSAALADQSYELDHGAVFLDGLLQDYFSDQRLGVFTSGPKLGLNLALTRREPICPSSPPKPETVAGSDRRRLLLPAQPEADGSGNLYELAIIALDLAILNGHFRDWDLAGIGADGSEETSIVLPRSRARLRLLPAMEEGDRVSLLRQFDVGLALRYAPALAPMAVEMAASGMSVVTNTFAGKDHATLSAISENFIPAEARVEAIAAALAAAERRCGDTEGRVSGARIEWPTSWDETFDDAAISAIERLGS